MPNSLYVNPDSGKLNSNKRFNFKWNGTCDNYTTAGKCTDNSIAAQHGFNWVIETHGYKLRDGNDGPRIFLASVSVPIGKAYIKAVQPTPSTFPAITVAEHTKLIDAMKDYRAYRNEMSERYPTSAGRPHKKGAA